MYDYGARMYMPDSGRWGGNDVIICIWLQMEKCIHMIINMVQVILEKIST
ncbi:hypothetical protein [Chryseobacterium arthrosphaerae]|nr:hypothetical protein [Chryseobacterium arthrosphaerae]